MVITLLVLIFVSIAVGGIIPQKIATSSSELESWSATHPLLVPWAERFGLFHLFTTPWFAVLLLTASLSLILSTVDQFKTACRKTFSFVSTGGRSTIVAISLDDLRQVLHHKGYLLVATEGERLRFVRHRWGYWSNALLHSGIVLVIITSLFIALTQQRGSLTLTEGTDFPPQAPWGSEEKGLLAPAFRRDFAVELDRLRVDTSGNRGTQTPAADLRFTDSRGATLRDLATINALLIYQGLRIYQTTNYGDAFRVEFIEPNGAIHKEELLLPFPLEADKAGYANFRLPWLGPELSSKYYADAGHRTLNSSDPVLFLRLMDGKTELSRISLRIGEGGNLGNIRVRLLQTVKWSNLVFVNIAGMDCIFIGFFLICLGAVMNYCLVPRELTAQKAANGCHIGWRAAKFASFYTEEYHDIIKILGGKSDQ